MLFLLDRKKKSVQVNLSGTHSESEESVRPIDLYSHLFSHTITIHDNRRTFYFIQNMVFELSHMAIEVFEVIFGPNQSFSHLINDFWKRSKIIVSDRRKSTLYRESCSPPYLSSSMWSTGLHTLLSIQMIIKSTPRQRSCLTTSWSIFLYMKKV